MPNTNITLDEWLKDEEQRLAEFKAFWLKNQEETPEHFPAKMPPGEWDEQYRGFTQ